VFDDLNALIAEGLYEKALIAAKRHSIDSVKATRRDHAALALAMGAEVLCALNHPAKARAFLAEAREFAARANDPLAAGVVEAIDALALLRLGEVEKAQAALDIAIVQVSKAPAGPLASSARLIGAELAMAREEWAEACDFADAAEAGALEDGVVRARAALVRAICAGRQEQHDRALEFLGRAEAELLKVRHVETLWQVRAAFANTCRTLSRDKACDTYRQSAGEVIQKIADELTPEMRDRFMKHSAVQAALGRDPLSASGLYKVPVQVALKKPPTKVIDGAALDSLRPIFEVIKKINSELDLRKLMTMILDTMLEYCNAHRGTIVVFEGDKYKIEVSRNKDREDLKRFEMGISRTVLKHVRENGRKIVADDAQHDPDLKMIDSVHENRLLSILCLPIKVKLRLVGAVYLDNPVAPAAFGPRQQEIAEILTDQAAIAIDNALLYQQSTHDHLTHLYNHSHFEKLLQLEVARCKRHGKPCGLLMLDLDNFKGINDTLGHDAGNEVLRAVARLLATATRNVDTVLRVKERESTGPVLARYGGDEFEIILPEAGPEGVEVVARRILEAMGSATFQYEGKPIKVAFSIGGAFTPGDAGDPHDLILRADEALYRAKRGGKNKFVAYSANV
jgi:diguanylate cyclase (GGDEF)-like protein